jgi:hypothetical protein
MLGTLRAGPPGPALPGFEQVDQGVDRGPGGPPHEIVAGCEGLRVLPRWSGYRYANTIA